MKYVLFLLLIPLMLIPAFADNSLTGEITIQTDKLEYNKNSLLVVSGTVYPVDGNTKVTIMIFDEEEHLVDGEELSVTADGLFLTTFLTGGSEWKEAGTYTAWAVYGQLRADTQFKYLL